MYRGSNYMTGFCQAQKQKHVDAACSDMLAHMLTRKNVLALPAHHSSQLHQTDSVATVS